MREDRATVLPEVKGIEGIAMSYDAITKSLLEEVIVVTMYVEYSSLRTLRGEVTYECGYDITRIIRLHHERSLLIAR